MSLEVIWRVKHTPKGVISLAWQEPVTDRDNTTYGNATDLNRIEGNTVELVNIISEYDIEPSIGATKTDWGNTDLPYIEELLRLEDNIKAIAEQTYTPLGWQEGTVDNKPDYTDFNRWENNLLWLKDQSRRIKEAFLYCGTFNCGSSNTEL